MASVRPLLIGIEIGGTKLQLGLGHGDGTIVALERRTILPARGAAGVRDQIVEALDVLKRRADTPIAAVGVGFGGPVDADCGRVTTSNQVPGWDDFSLANWLREAIGVANVSVQNDADTAGLGEARFGAGVGISPIVYVTIGSGIGGGLILDGKIYRGAGAGALEIGHLWVIDRNEVDLGVVTLEKSASGWAIGEAARRFAETHRHGGQAADWPVLVLAGGRPEDITAQHVAQAAHDGDLEARLILDRATTAMAHALGQAVSLLAPRRIILGGGVSLIGEDAWFAPIRKKLDACVFPPFRGSFDVVPAALGELVVVKGALALAADAAG